MAGNYEDVRRRARRVAGSSEADLEELRGLRDDIDDLLDIEDEEQAEQLESFIQSIGRSLYEAQKDLDRTSSSYMADAPPLASIFRIPKLSAELQLSLAASRQQGSGFILRRRRSTEDRSQQQKISFDVLAAPAPPEVLQGYRTLNVPIVTDPLLRRTLLEKVRTLAEDASAGSQASRAREFVRHYRRVLVVASRTWWILLLPLPGEADEEDRCNLDALYVERPASGAGLVGRAEYRGGGEEPPALPLRLRRLAWLLHQVSLEQADRLTAADGDGA